MNKLTDSEIDAVLKTVDFLNPQFNGWYARFIRVRGVDQFLLLTDRARKEGKDPAKFLSYLIKKEMK